MSPWIERAYEFGGFLLGVVGLGGAVMLAFSGLWALVWLLWRGFRNRVAKNAERIAARLSLKRVEPPDRRMLLWRGAVQQHVLWLAASATYDGPTGLMLDPAGPGFIDGAPRLSFARVTAVLLIARLSDPMPDPFTLSTMRSAVANLDTGDALFDRWFKLSGARSTAVRRVFSSAPLRNALLDIYGPDRDPNGTGIMIAANERALAVYWDTPRAVRTDDFARAVAYAVERLSARRDFF